MIFNQDSSSNQPLVEHLVELRYRLIRSAWAIIAGVLLCYAYSDWLFNIIRAPIAIYLPSGGLVFTAPADKFIAHLKISFFGGVILACPFWIYQLWRFIAPGLYAKEKKFSLGFIFSGTALFLSGVIFVYYVVLPMAFKFLMS